MSELEFTNEVIRRAGTAGWLIYHNYDSRKSHGRGFPDIVLARQGRVIFAELKTEKGGLRPAQRDWLEAIYPGTVADVFRPRDLDNGNIDLILSLGPPPCGVIDPHKLIQEQNDE